MFRRIACSAIAWLFLAAAAAAGAVLTAPTEIAQTARVPSPYGVMFTQIYKPSGRGPFPVAIFSHGRSALPSERTAMRHPISGMLTDYWMDRGYAVVVPFRPGYGLSGGQDQEDVYIKQCTVYAAYSLSAFAAATAIVAAVDWVRDQSWAQADHIVLIGQSAGGLGTVAAASRHPLGVVAYVNFAGGIGGYPGQLPGKSCQPEVLTKLYLEYGRRTSIPGIWLYAANDELWGPDSPKKWAEAYRAGNANTVAVFTGPVPNGKGHLLLDAPQLWRAQLDRFLKDHGL